MPTIELDKVCYVIVRARAFDAKVPAAEPDPGSNPSDDDMVEVLEDSDDDPVYWELHEFIADMNVDEQVELVALLWVGRGTFSADEWDEAVDEARRAHSNHTAEYLLGQPMLGDLLEEGIAAFGLSCSE